MKRTTPRRAPLKLPFKYETTKDFRIVNLESDGVLCIPVFGLSDYHGPRERVPEHTHPECMEISYCMRGELAFSCNGEEFPFRAGSVFVTKPQDRHRSSDDARQGIADVLDVLPRSEERISVSEAAALRSGLAERAVAESSEPGVSRHKASPCILSAHIAAVRHFAKPYGGAKIADAGCRNGIAPLDCRGFFQRGQYARLWTYRGFDTRDAG